MSNIEDNIVGVNTVIYKVIDKIKNISEPEINGNLHQQLNMLKQLTKISDIVVVYKRTVNSNLKGVIIENDWLDALNVDKNKLKGFISK